MVGREDQLTEILVWLSSAVPEVASAVIALGCGEPNIEPAQLEMATQHRIVEGRLDAVYWTDSIDLVVESKLDSKYGDGQLGKYLTWLAGMPHGHTRALMTLTKHESPWPAEDIALAETLGVIAAPKKWEHLFAQLLAIATNAELSDLALRLVQEFLDLLREEALVPVKPLQESELDDLWSNSEAVIRRYHDYFRACKDAISEALGASLRRNRTPASQTYIYQEFDMPDGEIVSVGLHFSDREIPIKPRVYRDSPTLWVAIYGERWPAWENRATHLEANPPEGWRTNSKRWYGQPQFWRYLADVVGSGSFDEQRARLAVACGDIGNWLIAQRPAIPPKASRLRRRH